MKQKCQIKGQSNYLLNAMGTENDDICNEEIETINSKKLYSTSEIEAGRIQFHKHDITIMYFDIIYSL